MSIINNNNNSAFIKSNSNQNDVNRSRSNSKQSIKSNKSNQNNNKPIINIQNMLYHNYIKNHHKNKNSYQKIGSFNTSQSLSVFNNTYLHKKNKTKSYLNQLKQIIYKTFKKINLWRSQQQFTYQGSSQNSIKQGYGILTYTDGTIYEGYFKNNKKHGKAKIIINSLPIFQGHFFQDQIQGQGYIKSLKLFTNLKESNFKTNIKQHKFFMKKQLSQNKKLGISNKYENSNFGLFQLREVAYSGNFKNNMFHGNGIIYLNSSQKIITNFNKGIPYGQLTYYCDEKIQFQNWEQ